VGSSSPNNLTALGNGTAVFSAKDGTHGIELWVTDGTAANTSLLKDINPGAIQSEQHYLTWQRQGCIPG
jgi:ELWxxDGT repeat protein